MAERAFSVEGLILIPKRQTLDPERTENMIISRDFWMSRALLDSYRVCDKCPPPPSPMANYKVCCVEHMLCRAQQALLRVILTE